MRQALARVFGVGILLGAGGCVQQMALEAQIEAAREARDAVQTLHDYEIARESALGGLGQLEMLHHLAPDDENAMMLLLQGWSGAASGFIEDQREQALEASEAVAAEYHRERARAAYARALHFGLLLLEKRKSGFDRVRTNADDLETWLQSPEHDAELLLWLGRAWLARVGVARDDPAVVAERYVGVALLERSAELDPRLSHGLANTILAGYHAALQEIERARELLAAAVGVHGGRYLPWRLVEARIACATGDEEAWREALEATVAAGDPLPAARLQNVIAMRRARRYLSSDFWWERCQQ